MEKKGLTREEYFKKYERDKSEIVKDQIQELDYPKPISRYTLVYEAGNQSLEPIYQWALGHLHYDLSYAQVDKITDIFSASEQSAMFGAASQRLGLIQDKAAQYLRLTHDLFKGFINLIRDIRILDEKLDYFNDSYKKGRDAESAEYALKGQFIDLVEGGAKNPMSVIGLAQEAKFTILPDLFYKLRLEPGEEIEVVLKKIEELEFTPTLKIMLSRKIKNYYTWKERLYAELTAREKYTLKYLRQQYHRMRMYQEWLKSYLKQAKRLNIDMQKASRAELVAAFDGSMVEIEVLGKQIPQGNSNVFNCIMLTFEYHTKPSMGFYAEPYHKGPVHVGEAKITWRSYAWTEKDIQNYKDMREQEDMELFASSDIGLQESFEALGQELKDILKRAGEDIDTEEEKEEKKPEKPKLRMKDLFEPLTALGEGFKDIGRIFVPEKKTKIPVEELTADEKILKREFGKAKSGAKALCWLHYKNFKKAHGMITW